MKLPSRTKTRWMATAPFVCLAVLVGLSWRLPNRVQHDERAAFRKAHVAEAMGTVPFFIGEWIGEDKEVPAEAQKLLRPNAIFSREYQRSGGGWAHVLVVHCSDARDMIGHYPPICYPSAGWVQVPLDEPADQTVKVGSNEIPVRLYEFRRMQERDREISIRIFSGFVLPDGTGSRDISDINRQSERLAVSAQGVAQVQVLTSGSIPGPDAAAIASELLNGMRELFDALRVGQGASRDT